MNDIHDISQIPVYLWIILATALFLQACWIFRDAAGKGERKWLWGLYGLLNIPGSLIVYLLVTRIIMKPNPCPSCKKNVRGNFTYCPHCGERLNK